MRNLGQRNAFGQNLNASEEPILLISIKQLHRSMDTSKGRHMSVDIPLKHRIRLWAALRWTVLIIAILFVAAYVGVVMHLTGQLERNYPDFLPKLGFYIHAVPGSIWFILGALQFFGYIRAKSPQAHRVMGTISLFMVIIAVAGGMMIVASGKAEGGISMEIFGTFFLVGWIVCCIFGWYYMRYQRNVEKHREWMTRAYVLSYAIILMRPAVIIFINVVPGATAGQALAIVGPFVWVLTLIILEIHIRRVRANQVDTERHYIALPSTPVSVEDGIQRMISYERDFVPVRLVQKQQLTGSTALFVFELPEKAELLMFPGHHVTLRRFSKHRQAICRPYTPVTELVRYFGSKDSSNPVMQSLNLPGTVALAVKKYKDGAMSEWLHDSIKIGDTVELMGPSGGFYYVPNQYRSLSLIAGGTGITPILSVILTVLKNHSDNTAVKLVYVNSMEQDVMFRDELNTLALQYLNKLSIVYLSGSGCVTREMLRENLPGPSDQHLVALCGPTGFCTKVQNTLTKLKYQEHTVFTFGETDK